MDNLLVVMEEGHTLAGNPLPRVTLVGATTDPDDLTEALLSRFDIKPVFDPHTTESMAEILRSMASKMDVTISDEVLLSLADAASGMPRLAGTLVANCRVLQDNQQIVTTERVLDFTGVTADGLTRRHLDYLAALWNNPKDGGEIEIYRMGFNQLCLVLGMPKKSVERLERQLITQGYIELLPTGRQLTRKATHLMASKEQPVHSRG
jgi:Holliday junction resolvasome RuvABC ATP-dependent DNA helicase subunit